MKKHLLLFVFCSAFVVPPAMAGKKHDGGKADRDKCRKGTVAAPEGLGELMFMLTPPSGETGCREKADLRRGMLEFCRWYMVHESQINAYQSPEDRDKELMLPFNISWQNIQEYFDFIRKNYPDILSAVSAGRSNASGSTPQKPLKETRTGVSASGSQAADSARSGFYASYNKY